jgi:hypothetical protein
MELLISSLAANGILGFFLWRSQRQVETILRASEMAREAQAEGAAAERAALIAMIEQPALAQTFASPAPSGERLHVPIDDDEAYAEYQQQIAAGEAN